MSRLYDRVMEHGCRRLNGGDVYTLGAALRVDPLEKARAEFREATGSDPGDEVASYLHAQKVSELSEHVSPLAVERDHT